MNKYKSLLSTILIYIGVIIVLSIGDSALAWVLLDNPYFYNLNEYTCEDDRFRTMSFSEEGLEKLYEFANENDLDAYTVMAVFMLNNEFSISEAACNSLTMYDYKKSYKAIERRKSADLKKLSNAYRTLLEDLVYFPLPKGSSEHSNNYYYGDSWGGARSYGGERTHEGTDIMDGENERGFFPVISVSDGTVENIGWLEQGGYRVGIRTKSGAYLYYAHLHSYADISEGDFIRAGELIGFMGDTGYSKIEGTTGNFDVHLHFGIYYKTDHYEELSVNPYYILRYLENNKLKYNY